MTLSDISTQKSLGFLSCLNLNDYIIQYPLNCPLVCSLTANYSVILICDRSPSISDGVLGGYCDGGIVCTDADTGCDLSSNICINCTVGHHGIHGYCIQGTYTLIIVKSGLTLKIKNIFLSSVLHSHKELMKVCPFGILRQLNPSYKLIII